jgi:GT2 family glycosyltransferase
MKNNISLLVGLKNNLDYNKHFYQTTRDLYPNIEICFVSYGSTDGTHEWLDSLDDSNLKYYYSEENKTFSDTFNQAAKLATKEYVAYLHNDIVLGPGFIENLQKHVSTENVVSYTTIEPPIFAGHERPGKLISDLGIDLESFDKVKFYEYCNIKQNEYANKTELGITFFMCMPRIKLLEIGGLDNLFNPMFCEDDDLINRWSLLGMKCFTALDAICYHFVSKTSRFSEEYQKRTQFIEIQSNKNYIRKWGSYKEKDANHQPIIAPKYNIAFKITNCAYQLLEVLEPLCDRIYTDCPHSSEYVKKEQPNTDYDLTKRVLGIDLNDPIAENDIVVEFDARKLTQRHFELLQALPKIIKDSGEIGTFELEDFTITINTIEEYQSNLVKLLK